MKYLALTLTLLAGPAMAQEKGFSPTMPFGIPSSAYTTQAPANYGGSQQQFNYNPYGYYYYYGGGGVFSGYGVNAPTSNGGNIPGYNRSSQQRDLPGYSTPRQSRKSDRLPGY